MNEFLLATALLMQAHLWWVLLALISFFVYAVTYSDWKILFLVAAAGYAMFGLYGVYLV